MCALGLSGGDPHDQRFPSLDFVFWTFDRRSGVSRSLLGSLYRLYPPPIIRWCRVRSVPIRQAKKVRLAPLGISSTSALSDLRKSKCFCLSYGRRYGVLVDPVPSKIVVCYRQAPVVPAAMVGELDFNAIQHAPCSQA